MSYLQKKNSTRWVQQNFNSSRICPYLPQGRDFFQDLPRPIKFNTFFSNFFGLSWGESWGLGGSVKSPNLKRWDMIATHCLRIFQGRMPWDPLRVSLLREPSIPTEVPLPSVVNYGYCLKLCKICESKSSTEFLKLELNGPTYYCEQAAGCGC